MQESQLRKATKEMEHALRVKREEEEKRAKMELRLEQIQQELTKMAAKYQSAYEQVQDLRTSMLKLEADSENLRRRQLQPRGILCSAAHHRGNLRASVTRAFEGKLRMLKPAMCSCLR